MGRTKALKEEAETSQEEPGVVYIGHMYVNCSIHAQIKLTMNL